MKKAPRKKIESIYKKEKKLSKKKKLFEEEDDSRCPICGNVLSYGECAWCGYGRR